VGDGHNGAWVDGGRCNVGDGACGTVQDEAWRGNEEPIVVGGHASRAGLSGRKKRQQRGRVGRTAFGRIYTRVRALSLK
jgi:hypothetical protein